MRAMLVRQRSVRCAAAAASVVLLAACGAKAGFNPASGPADPSASAGQGPTYTAGELAVSNGTNVVDIGGRKVTFPTTVTGASWSPDGSRLAFIDHDGNVATARIDGSDLIVLTKAASGVVRSRPAWSGAQVIFAEQKGKDKPLIMGVHANAVGALANTSNGAVMVTGEFRVGTGIAYDLAQQGIYVDGNEAAPSPLGFHVKGKELAFQRAGTKGPEIWVADLMQRTPYQSKVADGSEPALAPDGSKVAYVDKTGQIEVLATTGDKPKPVQVTFGVTAPTHLIWTPDGTHVTFQTSTDVESVSADVPAGATTNATAQVSAVPGTPTYLKAQKDKVTKFNGADPVATSIAASQARWPTTKDAFGGEGTNIAQSVVLAGTTNLATVLAGAQMVDAGPLLLTTGASLDPRTATEIKRVLGKPFEGEAGPPVIIVGGTDVVSTQAESAIRAMGYTPDRVSAKDPAAMALTAAGKPSTADMVFVVDAADTAAYAAAISSLGSWSQQTVLLTNGSELPTGVKTFLNQIPAKAKVYAVGAGAQAALSASWSGKPAKLSVTPYVGRTPAATPAVLLNTYTGSTQTIVVVNMSSLTDVIVGIGLARGYGAPVLAVDGKGDVNADVKTWLGKSSAAIDDVMIVDSANAVSAGVQSTVAGLVSGPLGYGSVANPKAPNPS